MKNIENILFVHWVNYWNIWDLGITDAMVSNFGEHFPEANLKIVTPYYTWPKPKNMTSEFHVDVYPDIFLFPAKWELSNIFKKLIFCLSFCINFVRIILFCLTFRLTGKKLSLLLNEKDRETIEKYTESNLIVSKWWWFLFDHWRFIISPHAIPIIIGLLLKKDVVIYAQSLWPFQRKFSEKLYAWIFKRVSHIIVREDISQKILSDMGIESSLGIDAAFWLEKTKDQSSIEKIDKEIWEKKEKYELLVWMSMLYWHFPFSKWDKDELYNSYVESLAESIKYIQSKHKTFFYFFPHSLEWVESDDRITINAVIKKAWIEKEFYQVVDTEYNPRLLSYKLSLLNMCIGSRMHSNIFTLLGSTPLIAISYLPKTEGIMRSLGLEHLTVQIDQITPLLMKNKIDLLMKDSTEISEKISTSVSKARADLVKNFEIIKKSL